LAQVAQAEQMTEVLGTQEPTEFPRALVITTQAAAAAAVPIAAQQVKTD
jgi:hypothetical protein